MKKMLLVAVLVVLGAAVFGYVSVKSRGATVVITDRAPWFAPAVLEIDAGTTVTWKSKAAAIHPVMTLDAPQEFNSGHFTDTWSYIFDTPGLYTYICPIHPYMKGVIGVGMKVPEDKIPAWVKQWPPTGTKTPAGLPAIPGEGEIWIATQFAEISGKEKPGSVTVVDAKTWDVSRVIGDERLNNPHNLWEVNGKILVTNWFDKFISVIDRATGVLEKHLWIGESPAHIHAHGTDQIYVTLQGDDGIAVLNDTFERTEIFKTPDGPHGHWFSGDGRYMALASTEEGTISVWDMTTNTKLFEEQVGEGVVEHHRMDNSLHVVPVVSAHEEHEETVESHPHSLPLMAGITPDGRYAFIATSNEGKFYVFDVQAKKRVKEFEIGSGPIQTVISPDGKRIFVPLSGDGALAVVRVSDWTLEKTIGDVGAGAHGVAFGRRTDGGSYAYVTNKFTTWLTVIDTKTLSVAGYVPLGNDAWGGQGVIVVE